KRSRSQFERHHLRPRSQPPTSRLCSRVCHRMFPQVRGHSSDRRKPLEQPVAFVTDKQRPACDTNIAIPPALPQLGQLCLGLPHAGSPDNARATVLRRCVTSRPIVVIAAPFLRMGSLTLQAPQDKASNRQEVPLCRPEHTLL